MFLFVILISVLLDRGRVVGKLVSHFFDRRFPAASFIILSSSALLCSRGEQHRCGRFFGKADTGGLVLIAVGIDVGGGGSFR